MIMKSLFDGARPLGVPCLSALALLPLLWVSASAQTPRARVQMESAAATPAPASDPPIIFNLHFEPGAPKTNDTLKGLFSIIEPDNDTTTTTVEWKRNGQPIDVTDNTIDLSVLGAGSVNDVFSLTVTSTDSTGSTATKTISTTVRNTLPTVSVSLSPTSPRTNDKLTAIYSANDADDGDISTTFAWNRNGRLIPGENSDVLDLSKAGNGDRGDRITAVLTATDAQGASVVGTATTTVANSSPVLQPDTNLRLSNINEDDTNSNGASILSLLNSQSPFPISDADTNDLTGVALYYAAGNPLVGRWEYSVNNGQNWTAIPVGADRAVLVEADGAARVRLIPSANNSGDAVLSFRAWDGFIGSEGQSLTVARPQGDSSTLSANVGTFNITVNPVDDAPTVDTVARNLVIDEDSVIAPFDVFVSDIDNAPSTLDLQVTSSDSSVIAPSGIKIEQIGSSNDSPRRFRVTLTLVPNGNGQTTITLHAVSGALSADKTILVDVQPIPDPPVIVGTTNPNPLITDEDTDLSITGLSANDPDDAQNAGSVTLKATVTNGTAHFAGSTTFSDSLQLQGSLQTIKNALATISFRPNPNYNGPASIQLSLDDANQSPNLRTLDISVRSVKDPVTIQDADYETQESTQLVSSLPVSNPDGGRTTLTIVTPPAHGTVRLRNFFNFTYDPTPFYNGPDSFVVRVTSNGVSAEATMHINILAVKGTPTANNDALNGTEDQTLVINAATLLANDANGEGPGEGTPLQVTGIVVPSNFPGTVTFDNNTQRITVVPRANFNGSASFDYTAKADSEVRATVTINFAPVADNPVANNDAFTVNEDTALTIRPSQLLANDNDPDDGALTVTAVTPEANFPGNLTTLSNGNVYFQPTPDFNGTATFTYQLRNAGGATSTGRVTITVLPVADPPLARDDAFSTNEKTPLTITLAQLTANDLNPEGTPLSLDRILADRGLSGRLEQTDAQTIVFTPAADFNGQTGFTYKLKDGNGKTSNAHVVLTVKPVNDPPVVPAQRIQAVAGKPTTTILSATDPENNPYTLSIRIAPRYGTATLVFDETQQQWILTYTPNRNIIGRDRIGILASDANDKTIATQTLIPIDIAKNYKPRAFSITPNDEKISVGSTLVLTQNVNDVDGVADVRNATLLITRSSESASPINGISATFDVETQTFTLRDDANRSDFGPAPIGASLSNSQGQITLLGVTPDRNDPKTLILVWRVRPTQEFIGTQNLWGRVTDFGGQLDGPRRLGRLTIQADATNQNAKSKSPSAPAS